MKIGVMKIGARLSLGSRNTSATNYDVWSIVDVLKDIEGNEIHIITGIGPQSRFPNYVTSHKIEKTDINALGLDILLVFNGNINFFGGKEAVDQIMNFYNINRFDGPIGYMNTDGLLNLKQPWNMIRLKDWKDNWNEEEINVYRTNIFYISQGYNADKIAQLAHKNKSVRFEPDQVFHFPIQDAIRYHTTKPVLPRKRVYDLIYGGSFRNGARELDMVKYYFGHEELEVLMFGSLRLSQFKDNPSGPPKFQGSVPHSDFVWKLSCGKSTVVIGDDWYKDNMITLRVYESMCANVLTFIDESFDPQHRIHKDPKMEELMYVHSKQDVIDRVKEMSSHESLRREVFDKQRDLFHDFDREEYKSNLMKVLANVKELYHDKYKASDNRVKSDSRNIGG